MPAGVSIEVEGLREFRRDLRRAGADMPKALRKANKKVADEVAARARTRAASGTRLQAKAAKQIKGRATATDASISVKSGIAGAAFWGTKRRSGWYNWHRYQGQGQRQHPTWVGAGWDVGVAGQGPYVINDTIAANLSMIETFYINEVMAVIQEAGLEEDRSIGHR